MSHSRAFRFCLALLLSGLAFHAAAEPAPLPINLIYNGGFNISASQGTQPAGWSIFTDPANPGSSPRQMIQRYLTSGGIGNSPCIEVGHSYERFTEFAYGSDNFARYRIGNANIVTVYANQFYKITVMYQTQGIGDNQAILQIDMFNGTSFIDARLYFLPPSPGWSQYTIYYRNIRASDRGFGQVNTDKVKIQLGVVSSLGVARYDDITMTAVTALEYTLNHPLLLASPPPLGVRRPRPTRFSPAPVYTIRQDPESRSFWLVRPDGVPVWLRAVQGINLSQQVNPVLFNSLPAAYRSGTATNNTYQVDSLARLGTLGFNSNAIRDGNAAAHPIGEGHIHPMFLNRDEYPSSLFLVDKNGQANTSRKAMPDPYNPGFLPFIRNYIRGNLDALGSAGPGHPDFVGYYVDNEIGVEYLDEYIWSESTSTEFILWVRDRYNGNIQAVNAAWSSPDYATFNMASFSEILLNKDKIIRHHLDDPLARDLNEFTKKMLKDYYRIICGIIRQYEVERLGDSDGDGIANIKHLICTNRYDLGRFPGANTNELIRAVEAVAEMNAEQPGFGFDILAVNNYPGDEFHEGIRTIDNFNMLERIAQISGLPVLISEFGVHGRDSGIPTGNNTTDDPGWFVRSVETQVDRGMAYDKAIRQWASSPYIIGAQWFKWINIMQEGSSLTPVSPDHPSYRGRNSGLVDNNNNFYVPLALQMQLTNAALDAAFTPLVVVQPADVWLQLLAYGDAVVSPDVNQDRAADIADLVQLLIR